MSGCGCPTPSSAGWTVAPVSPAWASWFITAHSIDPGWDGQITLEFYNSGRFPLALRPGMRICALSFEQLSSPTSRPYTAKKGAKYANQDGPLASRIDRDKDE